MPHQEHRYCVTIEWTGNLGHGTRNYRSYKRHHLISGNAKPSIPASSDPAFRGDAGMWNPEELLVASLSACHKLMYLHLCAENGVVVVGYVDRAEGVMVMVMDRDGGGRFVQVVLRPEIVLEAGSDAETARELHHRAHALCFIANSVNFPVRTDPVIRQEGGADPSGPRIGAH